MKEIGSNKRTYNVKIFGEVYELRKPKLGEQDALEAELAKEDGRKIGVLIEYFGKLGLPEDVVRELDSDEMVELIEFLASKKK